MKIVHISSGLGNQMLSYVEYLAIKHSNPEDECFIETILYEIPECDKVISQWNGYELERIFGIDAPNIFTKVTKNQKYEIIERVRASEFWKKNFNYSQYIVEALNYYGFNLINTKEDLTQVRYDVSTGIQKGRFWNLRKLVADVRQYAVLKAYLRNLYYRKFEKRIVARKSEADVLFLKSDFNIFTGQRLSFKFKGNGIEKLDKYIKEYFRFPEYTDRNNIQMSEYIKSREAVAIHARRGDMLQFNGECYKNGYFARAVNYIKKHTKNPVFIFFCDSGSIEWCKENASIFDLNFKKEQVKFVDWNRGKESYRDMQLMSECKHNIITSSTFGWWGAYLNEYPNKITCSPDGRMNTTHFF